MTESPRDRSEEPARRGGAADYLFELGQLKRVRRSGWWCAGVDHPESVAEHSWRVAAIAWLLAELEGADAERACTLAVFHDSGETRINDQHRLGQRYAGKDAGEGDVVRDQTVGLPAAIGEKLRGLWSEVKARESLEARIAKDADLLECLVQALEYRARGHDTEEWIVNCTDSLVTKSARRLAAECRARDPGAWWKEPR